MGIATDVQRMNFPHVGQEFQVELLNTKTSDVLLMAGERLLNFNEFQGIGLLLLEVSRRCALNPKAPK